MATSFYLNVSRTGQGTSYRNVRVEPSKYGDDFAVRFGVLVQLGDVFVARSEGTEAGREHVSRVTGPGKRSRHRDHADDPRVGVVLDHHKFSDEATLAVCEDDDTRQMFVGNKIGNVPSGIGHRRRIPGKLADDVHRVAGVMHAGDQRLEKTPRFIDPGDDHDRTQVAGLKPTGAGARCERAHLPLGSINVVPNPPLHSTDADGHSAGPRLIPAKSTMLSAT